MSDEGLIDSPAVSLAEDEWSIGGAATDDAALYLELDGWEGPLDLLLDLARRQKVDLRKISILGLVDQYLTYIEQAEALRLELARAARTVPGSTRSPPIRSGRARCRTGRGVADS